MISIKKVEVTPIDRNYASVVDSKSTQDDKTKNTYSMRVIDNELDGKVDGQFLTNNYYSKTDIDEITTSDTFHFLAGDEGGELDVVFKRVGKIVFVYYYPIVYGVQSGLQTMSIMDTIELPEWAKISETFEHNINICSKFQCYGWSSSASDGISLGSISRFSIVKQANGLYRLRYSYVDTNPAYTDPPENVYLVGENTSYLVY